jgi:sigma-B regulation protein RsbU (phosphoserine phosphatase)
MNPTFHPTSPPADTWQDRLAQVVETMREISRHTDPQEMNRVYRERMRRLRPVDGFVSLSRRGLERPAFRVTRSSTWKEEVNPWKENERLPLLSGGLLAELIYGDEPRIIDDVRVPPDDPAAEYLAGQRSLAAVPMYDGGRALNMVVMMRREPAAFAREDFPELVWVSNLYGRATKALVLAEELRQAYAAVDEEMQTVARIQRSLLPAGLPRVPTLDLAAHYQTSHRAGGDYYDFFPLDGGCWGILIADVSGHGTPAAVMMAITHAIAHLHPGPPVPPGLLLTHVNRHLVTRYTADSGTFVTAFYGVYDPSARTLTYANAGHPPPRLKRCSDGTRDSIDGVRRFPLGIDEDETYPEASRTFRPGDQVVFYTDGVTEAMSPGGELFGLTRLDEAMADCPATAAGLMSQVLGRLEEFTAGRPAADDRTILVAKVS